MADDAQPASKLAEQATAKGDASYSYWTSSTVKAGGTTVNPAHVPKKLSEEEAAALKAQQQRAGSGEGTSSSAWNAAGTFEERDATEWAKAAVTRVLSEVKGPRARVTAVTSVTGHASIWFIRGSKRAGFEFNIDLKWSAGEGDEEVAGTLQLTDASPDDLDDIEPASVAVSDARAGRGAAEAAAVREAKALAGPLRAALAAFYAELKQR